MIPHMPYGASTRFAGANLVRARIPEGVRFAAAVVVKVVARADSDRAKILGGAAAVCVVDMI
jgi:hypothetical protein